MLMPKAPSSPSILRWTSITAGFHPVGGKNQSRIKSQSASKSLNRLLGFGGRVADVVGRLALVLQLPFSVPAGARPSARAF
jgi:hypothetical protein